MKINDIIDTPDGENCNGCILLVEQVIRDYPYWCNAFKLPLDKDETGILKNYKCLENQEVK